MQEFDLRCHPPKGFVYASIGAPGGGGSWASFWTRLTTSHEVNMANRMYGAFADSCGQTKQRLLGWVDVHHGAGLNWRNDMTSVDLLARIIHPIAEGNEHGRWVAVTLGCHSFFIIKKMVNAVLTCTLYNSYMDQGSANAGWSLADNFAKGLYSAPCATLRGHINALFTRFLPNDQGGGLNPAFTRASNTVFMGGEVNPVSNHDQGEAGHNHRRYSISFHSGTCNVQSVPHVHTYVNERECQAICDAKLTVQVLLCCRRLCINPVFHYAFSS